MKKGKFKPIKNQRSILDFFTSFKNPSIVNGPLKTEIEQECLVENESNNNEHLLKNLSIEIPKVRKDDDSTNKYVNVDKLIYQLLNGRVVLKRLSPRLIRKLTNSSIPKHITKHKIKIKLEPEERFYRDILNDKRIPNKLIKHCNSCNKTFEDPQKHRTSCPDCSTSVVYKCMKCSQEFKTRNLIIYHWKDKCNPTRYMQCLKCDYKTCCRRYMVNHVRRMHMTFAKNIRCKFCRYTTNFYDYLEKHIRRSHRIVKMKVETKTEGWCEAEH